MFTTTERDNTFVIRDFTQMRVIGALVAIVFVIFLGGVALNQTKAIPLLLFVMIVLAAGYAVWFVVTIRITRTTVDAISRSVTIQRRRLLGSATSTYEFDETNGMRIMGFERAAGYSRHPDAPPSLFAIELSLKFDENARVTETASTNRNEVAAAVERANLLIGVKIDQSLNIDA